MSEVIYLSDVRLSFPHLVEPQRTTNEQTGVVRVSYSVELIMPADHPGFKEFTQKYGELALAKWGEHAQNVMKLIQADRKLRCYGEGNEKVNKKTFEPYDGYAGNVYITAGRSTPPQIIQDNGSPIDPNDTMAYGQLTRKMYGGCHVNVAIKPWLQDNKHGRGVRCELIAVQFAKDDDAFGGGVTDASGMFGATGQSTPTVEPTGAGLPPFMS
jgi:hypothetical protein